MAKNKEATTDEFAIMVQKGFESMDKGFDHVNMRLDGV